GIAKNGVMPWKIPDDERYFTEQTKRFGGAVLTGGVTYRDGYKSRPLRDRENYIVTHGNTPIEGATVVNDLQAFLTEGGDKDLWVAGGAAVFEQVIDQADELYITYIDADF